MPTCPAHVSRRPRFGFGGIGLNRFGTSGIGVTRARFATSRSVSARPDDYGNGSGVTRARFVSRSGSLQLLPDISFPLLRLQPCYHFLGFPQLFLQLVFPPGRRRHRLIRWLSGRRFWDGYFFDSEDLDAPPLGSPVVHDAGAENVLRAIL